MRTIKFRMWNGVMHPVWYRIDSDGIDEIDILMQYTGLKDKNGKEIYEGDIMRWVDWDQEGYEKPDMYEVIYDAPTFIWRIYRFGKILEEEQITETHNFEVIGNIYENPELLKQS